MTSLPYDREAFDLLHEGAIALAEVESNGICIDVDYLHRTLIKTDETIKTMQEEMKDTKVAKEWLKKYGDKVNHNSRLQLGTLLFDDMGYKSIGATATGRHRTDKEALSHVKDPFIEKYQHIAKLQKAVSTNLKGILREVTRGKVHCFYNLHTTMTYRSSSDSFNFQNIPVRDFEIADLIRRAFIARPGRQLVEFDISGAEVRVSCCYHEDPTMVAYILDPTKDMHRDMAMDLYKLHDQPAEYWKDKHTGKKTRYCAKNMFVFPQFYGSYYVDCARHLWEAIANMGLVTSDGKSLKEHLAGKGITKLGRCDPDHDPVKGTFEYHIREVENNFWGKRFPVYSMWKRRWYADYLKQGWFKTLTGFICQGYMRRNEAVNYPVQGSAFHCLLWALVRLVRVELKRRHMQSLIVGQIHDSIVADVVPSELPELLSICKDVMTHQVCQHYPWINVPMEIEADVCPVGGSWAEKAEYAL